MSEEQRAVDEEIEEELEGRYYDDPDDYGYDDDDEYYEGSARVYDAGYQDGYQAGLKSAHEHSLIARLKAFMVRWWVNRRMRAYAQDIDDIPF